jgi:flagellar biosynthesis protein FlhA
MDGASKFVKGDAIAGIVIMLINIIGGPGHRRDADGHAVGRGLHTFTLLTIGDGIVTQIPVAGDRGRHRHHHHALGDTSDARAVDMARVARYTLVDGPTVLLTHLNEVIRQQVAVLLTRGQTGLMMERLRKTQGPLVDELIPNVLSMSEVQRVLQDLLREKVSIRNLEFIVEVLVDSGRSVKDPIQLTELVRQRLSAAICEPLVGASGFLQVLTFDPAVEQGLAKLLHNSQSVRGLPMEPRFAEQLLSATAQQVEKMMKASMVPVMLCAPELRRHVRAMTERVLPHLRVLSITEVPSTVTLKSFGTVGSGMNVGAA